MEKMSLTDVPRTSQSRFSKLSSISTGGKWGNAVSYARRDQRRAYRPGERML